MATTPELGDVIEAYCEHCRLPLDVSIAAMDGDQILQVQCRTCQNFVRYRPASDARTRRQRVIKRVLASRDRKSSRSADSPSAEETPPAPQRPAVDPRWLELTEGVDSTGAVPYTHYRRFSEGDYVLHKSYGMGYVQRLEDDERIIVIFREGEQTLLINQPYDE